MQNIYSNEKDSDTQSDQPQSTRLLNVLYSLEEQIGRQTSLRFAFLKGVVYGLGTVVGATLLIALFGGVLATTVDSLAELPLIGKYINEDAAAEYLPEE